MVELILESCNHFATAICILLAETGDTVGFFFTTFHHRVRLASSFSSLWPVLIADCSHTPRIEPNWRFSKKEWTKKIRGWDKAQYNKAKKKFILVQRERMSLIHPWAAKGRHTGTHRKSSKIVRWKRESKKNSHEIITARTVSSKKTNRPCGAIGRLLSHRPHPSRPMEKPFLRRGSLTCGGGAGRLRSFFFRLALARWFLRLCVRWLYIFLRWKVFF